MIDTEPVEVVLPKDAADAAPEAFKQWERVSETIQKLDQLSGEEKASLQKMITAEDGQLLEVVKKSETAEQLATNLVKLVHAQMQRMDDTTDEPAKMDEGAEEMDTETLAFNQALAQIGTNKATIAKPALAQLLKMLQSIQKKPDDIKLRKHRLDNIMIKKFVMDVIGARKFMELVGFTTIEEMKAGQAHAYFSLAVVDEHKLELAISLLGDQSQSVKKSLGEPKTPANRRKCEGGCGFWGEEKTDFYCSVCYKKKFMGLKDDNKPKKCPNECGFFGAERFGGLCSVCHEKKLSSQPKAYKKKLRRAMLKLSAVYRFKKADRLKQTNKNRCWTCSRKVGITGIECRCGYIFCGQHRYAYMHDCVFDHKELHKNKLRKDNKQIVKAKFDRVDG